MKFSKVFAGALTGCILVGASASAMAECGNDGLIRNETIPTDLIITENCSVISSTIEGNLIVRNTAYVLLFNNEVEGTIRVNGNGGGTGQVIGNKSYNGPIVVRDLEYANVIGNETPPGNARGNIRVNGNTSAVVRKNTAAVNLVCKENTVLEASLNVAGARFACDPSKQ